MNDATTEVVEETEVPEAEAEVTEVEETAELDEANEEPSESSTEKKEDVDKVQQRIDEITRIRRQEEREKIAAKREAEELRKQLEELKPKQKPGMTLEDFDYDAEKYSEYIREQEREVAREEAQQSARQREAEERQAEFSVKERDFASEKSDYFTVTRNPALNINQQMVDVAMGAESGPALIYHLAENPDVADKLSRMPPWDMAREMGKLEATALTPKASVTEAPPPPPKIKGASKAQTISASSADSDKLSTEEWLARRNKELAKSA